MTSYGSTDDEHISDAQPSMKDIPASYHEADFELGQTHYLPSSTNCKKGLLAFLPVIIFIALMGGVVWAMNKDFNHLYPGHGSSGSNDSDDVRSKSSTLPIAPSVPLTPEVPSQPVPQKPSDSSSCAIHSKCADLGLTGHCCPTSSGTFLACC